MSEIDVCPRRGTVEVERVADSSTEVAGMMASPPMVFMTPIEWSRWMEKGHAFSKPSVKGEVERAVIT